MPMPETLYPKNRGIQLVSPGETIQVITTESGDDYFKSEKKRFYELQDIFGEIFLGGFRWEEDLMRPRKGIVIKDNKVLIDDADTIRTQHPDLFALYVQAETGRSVPGHVFFCTLHIPDISMQYHCVMNIFDEEILEPTASADEWRSSDPNDANIYYVFASPEDIPFLSSLRFSFDVVKKHPEQ